MKTAKEWVGEIEALFDGQKNGRIKPPQAVEMNNTIGKLIAITKLQLEYAKAKVQLGALKVQIEMLDLPSSK